MNKPITAEELLGHTSSDPAPTPQPANERAFLRGGSDVFEIALAEEGIDDPVLAGLARSIHQQESGGGRNTKTSNAGAVGGMQILPGTFKEVADGDWDIANPVHNARAGIRYVKAMADRVNGDPLLTAVGYYGGPGAQQKARNGVAVSDPRNPKAPNTLQYAQQVVSRIPELATGKVTPATPKESGAITAEELLSMTGGLGLTERPAPIPERSAGEAVGDLAIGVAQGGLGAVQAVTDIFGADNPASRLLNDGSKALQNAKSDRAQQIARASQQRIEDAKGEGTMAEIGAYLDAVWDAPLDMTAQAAGSFLPFLFTGGVAAGARLLGLSNAAKTAGVTKKVFLDSPAGKAVAQEIAKNVGTKFTKPVNTAVGVAMGLGGVKGQQYETTLREAKAAGKSDEEAKQLATEAQAYGNSVGGTLQQIGGAALGGVAAATGPLERALSRIPGAAPSSRGIFGRAGVGALKESFPEGGQAFHQAWAGNEAAIDAGVMDPSRRFEGAAGQAIQEAVLVAPMGGAAGAMEPGPVRQNKPAPAPARQPTTPVAPPVAPAASPATPPAPAVGPTASTPTASPLDLGDASIDPAMAKLSDEELQAMMADVEAREEDATDDDWVNYSAAMAELDRRKTPPATPTAPKDEAAKLSSIFDTDTVYQGWSNVRDGSDRADMLAQIDDVAEMYRKSPVLSGYTPEQLDYELKTAYKWYRSAEPAQRQAAVEQILGRKVETPAKPEGSAEQKTSETPASSDPLYGSALEFAIVDEAGTTSIAKLQGALRIGYNRAARLIEDMVAAGDLAPNERGGYNVLGEKPKARANDQEIASAPPEAPSNLFGELPDAEPDAIEQPEAPEYDYYDAAYAIDDDTRNLIDRYVPADVDDDLIPGFDAAADNPASDEDFLRQIGATDEEIADALSITQQSPRAQSADPSPVAAAPDVAASPQAVSERPAQEPQELGTAQQGDVLNNVGLPFKFRKAAEQAAKNTGAQVVPVQGGFVVRMPQNMSGTPSATMGTRTDAKAGPGFTAADVVRRDPIAGQKINDEWTAFAPQSGTLGIPRAEMPQVKAGDRGAMVNFLKARGIDSSKEQLPPTALKPTQAEFSPAKVQEAADRTDGDRSIIVSADGYVVDGHHQWLAQRQKGEPINVIRLDQPITQVLDALKEMPSAQPAQKQDVSLTNEGDKDATLTNEGAMPAIDPSTLAAKQRWEQRQAEEKQQAAQNQQENERYNAYVQEQEKDAERRRLQGDNIIQQANGKPFKTEASAQAKLDEFDLADTHAIQKTDKGFVLRQMPPAEQAERQRKAEGRESYTEAQAAVAAEMGIGENADGELDATDKQFAEMERRVAERMGRKLPPEESKPNQPAAQQAPAVTATENVANPAQPQELPPTDIRVGDKVMVDGEPYTVTGPLKDGKKVVGVVASRDGDTNPLAGVRQVFLRGDEAIAARVAAQKAQAATESVANGAQGEDSPLPPKLSSQLQEAHKSIGRGVTRRQAQSMRDRIASEIESGTTNNGGVIGKLRPAMITQRRSQLARLDKDLALFDSLAPRADEAAGQSKSSAAQDASATWEKMTTAARLVAIVASDPRMSTARGTPTKEAKGLADLPLSGFAEVDRTALQPYIDLHAPKDSAKTAGQQGSRGPDASREWVNEGKTDADLLAEKVQDLGRDLAGTIYEESRLSDFKPSELPAVVRMWAEDNDVPSDDLSNAVMASLDRYDFSEGRKRQVRNAIGKPPQEFSESVKRALVAKKLLVDKDGGTSTQPIASAADSQLEAIFAGLEADGLKKRKAEAALAERTDDAEVINQVEAQFYDLLTSLMDRGDLEVNGHKTIHEDNKSCL